jgi:tetratricopeptide (TPR) repeat protein
MVDTAQDIQQLVDALEAKERRGRRNAMLYLGLPLIAGLALTFWTAWQARTLRENEKKLVSLQEEIKNQKTALEDATAQLRKTRSAIEYVRFGINSFQAGNFSAAVRAYDRAIELDPMNPVVFDLKGYSLLREGKVPEAIAALRRSVDIDHNYIWGHYNLALAYWAAGDRSNAVAEVKQVLQIDPSFKEVIGNDVQFKKFNASPAYQELMK